MSYLNIWTKIKELNAQETADWINAVQPATGMQIDFRGVRVVDVDVLNALRQWQEDLKE